MEIIGLKALLNTKTFLKYGEMKDKTKKFRRNKEKILKNWKSKEIFFERVLNYRYVNWL